MKLRRTASHNQLDLRVFRSRLAVGGLFVLLLFGVLIARFIYLQIYRHDHYTTLAENNRIALVPITPNRGLILDRNGVILAHNYSAYTLEITPDKAGNVKETPSSVQGVRAPQTLCFAFLHESWLISFCSGQQWALKVK